MPFWHRAFGGAVLMGRDATASPTPFDRTTPATARPARPRTLPARTGRGACRRTVLPALRRLAPRDRERPGGGQLARAGPDRNVWQDQRNHSRSQRDGCTRKRSDASLCSTPWAASTRSRAKSTPAQVSNSSKCSRAATTSEWPIFPSRSSCLTSLIGTRRVIRSSPWSNCVSRRSWQFSTSTV